MKLSVPEGAFGETLELFIMDNAHSDGRGLTGLNYAASGLSAYFVRPRSAAVQIVLGSLGSPSAAWSSGGFVEIDATNMPGVYRFDIPNACLASGVDHCVVLMKGAAGMAPLPIEMQLVTSALAIVSTPIDTAAIADKILGRNLAGGADGGRTVKDALRANRNKVEESAGTVTVYAEDDTTPAWTATVTRSVGAAPIIAVDPA